MYSMAYRYSDSWLTPNNDIEIYRYFNEYKFLSLLETKSLYFNEILKYRKNDKMEGALPHNNKRCIGRQYLSVSLRGKTIGADKSILKKYQIINFIHKLTAVNCWNMGNGENRQMWNVYAKDKRGILIKSDIESLKKSFSNMDRDVYIGKVLYVNHKSYIHSNPNPFSYAFLKDRELFEWEQEVRLLTYDFESRECDALNEAMRIYKAKDFFNIDFDNKRGIDNILVECDLRQLIKEIIVSPWADSSFVEELREILCKHKIEVPIKKSDFVGNIDVEGKLMEL